MMKQADAPAPLTRLLAARRWLLAVAVLGFGGALPAQTFSTLVFNDPDPELVAGVDLAVGAQYLFQEVSLGVDAIVEIMALDNGASLGRIDDHAETTPTDLFYPTLTGDPTQNSRVMFEMSFVDSGTGLPVELDFRWTLADLDSSESGNGTIFEVGILENIANYTLEGNPADPTNLTHTEGPSGEHLFSSNPNIENFSGVDLNDTVVMVYTEYTDTSSFQFGFELEGTQTSSTRNVAASGLSTISDNFVDPVTVQTPEPGIAVLLALAFAGACGFRAREAKMC
ncbi:MAG: hypothetical protein HKN82_13630 [Akkermansiaceae bacterium]|nr:hypothetical protein [Akkermansiaceae bacterium]